MAGVENIPTWVLQNKTDSLGNAVIQGGVDIVKHVPVFSPDSKYLLCCCGDVVKVFSIDSGECAQKLKSHEDEVTSVAISKTNQFQALTTSKDKHIILWNYLDGIKIKAFEVKHPLYRIVPYGTSHNALLIVKTAANSFDLWSSSLRKTSGRNLGRKTIETRLNKWSSHLSIGGRDSFVALIKAGHNSPTNMIVLFRFESAFRNSIKMPNATCVAGHPTDDCIAVGTTGGHIEVWYNIFGKRLVKHDRHWHTSAVNHITFSSEGSFVLSGGAEKVLVKWPTFAEEDSEADKLPRLGSSIIKLVCSPDNTRYAVCHDDNSIQIVSSSFKVIQVYQGLTHAKNKHKEEDPVPTGLLIDPRTNALVLNGRPGHLQFYSICNEKQLYSLDIVGQNYVDRMDRPKVFTEVENAAFSYDGKWLATVERRDDRESSLELNLKFWEFQDKIQEYELNTNVYLPHNDRVIAMKFRPAHPNPVLVTSSDDTRFKIWSAVDDIHIHGANERWTCESVGFYRDRPAGHLDFSEDGSLLAVAFGPILTLWDPDTNHLRNTLMLPGQSDNIRQLLFAREKNAHLLLSVTSSCLTAWNLLNTRPAWTVATKVNLLVPDTLSNYVAAFTAENAMHIFQPSNPEPVFTRNQLSDSPIIYGIFIPHPHVDRISLFEWQAFSDLYFMDSKQKLMSFGTKTDHSDTEVQLKEHSVIHLPETPFQTLLSHQKQNPLNRSNAQKFHINSGQSHNGHIDQFLSTPAHVLVPVASLCHGFLGELMIKTKSGAKIESSVRISDEEKESDMEVDGVANIKKNGLGQESDDNVNKANVEKKVDNKQSDFGWLAEVV